MVKTWVTRPAFSVRERAARKGRNPRTGVAVSVPAKRVPFFKVGKESILFWQQ